MKASETAIVVVDVWNKGECPVVFQRLEAMLPTMQDCLSEARGKGVTIIHGPTGAMKPYEGTPARDVMMTVPKLLALGKTWGGKLTVDWQPPWASTGGCECNAERKCAVDKRANRSITLAQHPVLGITDDDFIVDGDSPDELFSVCRHRRIANLYYVGQALNMCIVGRAYGMEVMKRLGFRVNYSRDLTIVVSGNGFNPDTGKPDLSLNPYTAMSTVRVFMDKYVAKGIESKDFLEGLG